MVTATRSDTSIADYLHSLRTDALPHHAFLFVDSCESRAERHVQEWLSHLGITDRMTLGGVDEDGKRERIKVEHVRSCLRMLAQTSFSEGYRAVVINRGDELSEGGSHALLKSIEEPPEKTIFIILASDARAVLSTIASRCWIFRFPLLSLDGMGGLSGGELDAIRFRATHSFADGALSGEELNENDCARIEAFFSGQLHSPSPDIAPLRVATLYDSFVRARALVRAHIPAGRALEATFL